MGRSREGGPERKTHDRSLFLLPSDTDNRGYIVIDGEEIPRSELMVLGKQGEKFAVLAQGQAGLNRLAAKKLFDFSGTAVVIAFVNVGVYRPVYNTVFELATTVTGPKFEVRFNIPSQSETETSRSGS